MESAKLLPLTSRTRVAFAIARGIAAARGDRNLTATHVAIGVLREGANPALSALWYAGLSESVIRRLHLELEDRLGDEPGNIPPRQVAINSTPGEEEVLRIGDIEAQRLGDPYLGTEHVLLAILRSDHTAAEPFLQRGISPEKYCIGLTSSRRGDPPPAESGAV